MVSGVSVDECDHQLADTVLFYRRIPALKVVSYVDELGTHLRPSSDCFTDNSSSMSLFAKDECGGLAVVMEGHGGFLLVQLTAGQLRSVGLQLVQAFAGGPGHYEAIGKKTNSIKLRLAKMCEWVIAPVRSE